MREVKISVEFFGMARIIAGTSLLKGVIRKNCLALEESYVFNLNGESFFNSENLNFHEGDKILLFSSQAGG